MPLLSVYSARKAAVNAFTEVLALVLEQLKIRVHLVVPGRSPDTSCSEALRGRLTGIPDADVGLFQAFSDGWCEPSPVTPAPDLGDAVGLVATGPVSTFRIAAGADALALLEA